ncbi:MAG TPA: TM2 domain-containing protein [Pyrinomonadaceae bacterium]|nr:TM2 domain-containing protein [Pyrinomonadaceae bacterium]
MDEQLISKEKKLTLILLCWLFGLFGVHRFYTGKYLTGGLQLLMLLSAVVLGLFEAEILPYIPAGILLLWWVIDILQIIMGKFSDKEGKPVIDWV